VEVEALARDPPSAHQPGACLQTETLPHHICMGWFDSMFKFFAIETE
jgi:hypothetical protein